MAPGTSKRTFTMNGVSQSLEILRTEAGPGTGDTRYIARDAQGNTVILQSYSAVDATPTDTPTGDQWGTLG